jgi:1-phosphofructokinase family hexose kinase
LLIIVSLNSCLDKSLVISDFKVGSVCTGELLRQTPAGKGVNVACILAALQKEAVLQGFIGVGEEELFAKCLAHSSVSNHLTSLDFATRVNTTILDYKNNRETHIRERGAEISPKQLQKLQENLQTEIAKSTTNNKWIVFCGSLPPGISAADFKALLISLKKSGVSIGVDISGEALATALAAGVDLIKPNRDELLELISTLNLTKQNQTTDNDIAKNPLSMLELGQQIIAKYSNLQILASDGKAGAYYISASQSWQAKYQAEVKVKNTVGAGDALLAGFLASLMAENNLSSCLENGILTATASLSCIAAGELDFNIIKAHENKTEQILIRQL